MAPLRVRYFVTRRPFIPFTIRTTDGSEVRVVSPESVSLLPGNQTLLVATGREQDSKVEEVEVIDVFHISKITMIQPAGDLAATGGPDHGAQ